MATTLVWRTDAHLADQPPQSRIDDWAGTILGKLTQVGDVARQFNASLVLDGGDLFHVKSPSRTSHELVQRVAEIHRAYPCPTAGNVGNHDVKYGDFRFLSEAPLGVLFQSRVLLPCYGDSELYLGWGGTRMQVYPYNRVTGWGRAGNPFASREAKKEPLIRIVGIPFHGTAYDVNRFSAITKGKEDYLVVMVHCLASEQGGSMFEAEDIIKYEDLVSLDPDVYFFGHWHKDQGIKQIAKDKWVVNTGSLSRGSISQDDVGRVPVCVAVSFDFPGVGSSPITFQKVPLQVVPSADVFDLVGKTRQEGRKMTVDALVDSLKTSLTVRQEGSLLEEVKALPDVPDPVKERTLGYLERAGAR